MRLARYGKLGVVLIAVCWGGTWGATRGAEPVAAPKSAGAERPLTIVAFGDSTTAPRGPLHVYAQVLQEELPRHGIPAQVINAGIGGHTTADAARRFEKDVLARRPDVVIMQFGLNDGSVEVWRKPPATQPRVAVADYRENLRKMIESLKLRGVHVILMSFNPMRWTPKMRELYGRPPYRVDVADGFNVVLQDYLQTVRELARTEQVSFLDVYAAYEKYHAVPGRSMDALFSDGVHPNDEGQRIVADLILAELDRLKSRGSLRASGLAAQGWQPGGPEMSIHPRSRDISPSTPHETVMGAALVPLADGRVLSVYSAPTTYSSPPGTSYIALRTTADGGKTWSAEREITRHADAQATHATAMQDAAGQLHVFYLGFKKFEWKEGNPTENCISNLWTIRSMDGGKTWTDRKQVFSGYTGSTNGAMETRNKVLVVPFSQYTTGPGRLLSRTAVSRDAGLTWELSTLLDIGGKGDHDGAVEPCVIELADGRLWLLIRTSRGVFWESFSTDDGRTWSAAHPTKIPAAHAPGFLRRLRDGRLALVWNPQHSGRTELHLAISADEGRTWSRSVPVVVGKQVTYPYLLEYAPGEAWISLFDIHRDWHTPQLRILSVSLRDLSLSQK